MFVFQKSFASPCKECTKEIFYELVSSSVVVGAVQDARYYQAEIDKLPSELTEEEAKIKKQYEAKKQNAKKRLPGLIFQATFVETQSKKGFVGKWRKNSAAVLNGLFMLDVDHLTHDEMTFIDAAMRPYFGNLILLAFMTASGHGLKIVAKADPKIGNIEANQKQLASQIGATFDTACKDAARISFCPSKEDIIYINDELFTYNNEEFNQIFGAGYRDGSLSVARVFNNGAGINGTSDTSNAANHTAQNERLSSSDSPAVGGSDTEGGKQMGNPCGGTGLPADDKAGLSKVDFPQEFAGVSYGVILEKYIELKGAPQVGARHQWLLKMAKDMRYICDFKPGHLARVMMLCQTAKDVANERGESEILKIAEAACSYRFYSGFPKDIKEACRLCEIDLSKKEAQTDNQSTVTIDYDYWWSRLRPLLTEGDAYSDAVAGIADRNKLGGILAAGAMYGTYLTRCQFPFYDGKNYKFSYIVYIIGHAASGKSFIIDMDKELMAAIKRQDESYRQMEKEYKEQKERMSTSSKDAKDKAPQRPHYPIRYVPSTISNAKLYARLQDAVDLEDDTLHLHLFTLESELATALRVQVGSWAGKLDLELKSFQNEYAGVDYANELSANGLIQVNWNQVISGTMDALKRKMRGGSITDGYITRMALWIMPNSEYTMIEKKYSSVQVDTPEEAERKNRIKQRVVALDQLRCVFSQVQKLSDYCWEWCASQCKTAEIEEDACIEYFRKRIPLYMMRYTLPRIVCRQLDKFEGGYLKEGMQLEVTEDDLQFASLIGDYLMFISIYQWGQQYIEFTEEERRNVMPRKRKSAFADRFFELPKDFTFADIRKYYSSDAAARRAVSTLVTSNVVKKTGKDKWQKLLDSIDDMRLR